MASHIKLIRTGIKRRGENIIEDDIVKIACIKTKQTAQK